MNGKNITELIVATEISKRKKNARNVFFFLWRKDIKEL
jgi:hypothetical protein